MTVKANFYAGLTTIMESFSTKEQCRRLFRKHRASLSDQRRQEGKANLEREIQGIAIAHERILSYASFGDELDTSGLNTWLASHHKLVLPRTESELSAPTLTLFHVEHPENQMELSQWKISEPIPHRCIQVALSQISLILIPGLAYDRQGHRLGYGRGFYDRLLTQLSPKVRTIGVGYKEQLSETDLPVDSWDQRVQTVLLC